MAPLLPGHRPRDQRRRASGPSIGPINFQPGEFAKVVLAIFFASYLVEKRELLGMATWPRFRPMLPDLKYLGPVLLAWGVSIVIMTAEKDLGSSLLFFALFMLMLWVATERAAYLVVGAVLFVAGAYVRLQDVRPRAGARRHLARPVDGHRRQRASRSSRLVRDGVGRRGGHRARTRQPGPHPGGRRPTSSSPRSPRSSACSAPSAMHRLLHAAGRLRLAHRGPRRAAVREAARRRAHHPARRAVVHHHGGRHAAAPAHRRDAAVRVVRRIVARRQLRAARAARCGSPTTPRPHGEVAATPNAARQPRADAHGGR